MAEEVADTKLWPVTIFSTRYGGTYEGGQWAAFNMDPMSIPDAVMGSDIECSDWWNYFGGGVGVGRTPEAALLDLVKLEKRLQWKDLRAFAQTSEDD